MTSSKISVDGVSKDFATRDRGSFVALQSIDLEIAESEFVSLLGPSGCGKSTLLEIVAGLQKPSAGEVRVDGRRISGPGSDRTLVFQHYALFPWRKVVDNVAFPLEMAGVGRTERRQRAREFLDMVGLEGFGDHHIWQLSGGMQQRVGLARALVCEPKVLLMDEPFSGADAITRELLQEQLRELHAQTKKTVLFVTHAVDEALRLAQRIVVMGTRPGRIVREFTVVRGDDGTVVDEHALRDAIWAILREEIRPEAAALAVKPLAAPAPEQDKVAT
jgi:NitT/TauT family transport system ATP-binding protein